MQAGRMRSVSLRHCALRTIRVHELPDCSGWAATRHLDIAGLECGASTCSSVRPLEVRAAAELRITQQWSDKRGRLADSSSHCQDKMQVGSLPRTVIASNHINGPAGPRSLVLALLPFLTMY